MKKRSWLRIALPALVVLIAAAGLEYWLGGWKLVKKEFARQQVSGGACSLSCGAGPGAFPFPKDTGPENAKVKIVAYVNYNIHCHSDGCMALYELAKKYPDDVRFEIRDATSEEGQKVAQQRHIDTLMWLLINDMDKIKLPDRAEPIAFRGPPGAISYDLRDIEAIIKYALTEKGARDLAKQREQALKSLKLMSEKAGEESFKPGNKAGVTNKSNRPVVAPSTNPKKAGPEKPEAKPSEQKASPTAAENRQPGGQ